MRERNEAFISHIKVCADSALAHLYEALILNESFHAAVALLPHLQDSIPGYSEPEEVLACMPDYMREARVMVTQNETVAAAMRQQEMTVIPFA